MVVQVKDTPSLSLQVDKILSVCYRGTTAFPMIVQVDWWLEEGHVFMVSSAHLLAGQFWFKAHH